MSTVVAACPHAAARVAVTVAVTIRFAARQRVDIQRAPAGVVFQAGRTAGHRSSAPRSAAPGIRIHELPGDFFTQVNRVR